MVMPAKNDRSLFCLEPLHHGLDNWGHIVVLVLGEAATEEGAGFGIG